jgi:hypothetical protein
MSFAIFTPKARKLVNDARMTWMAAAVKGDQVVFVYRRVYRANCSLFSSGDRCWRAIESEIGLLVLEQMPGCRASYVAEQKRVPKFAKQTADDQTVVEYDAALWIDRKGPSIGPIASTKVTCRPAE